MSTAHHGAKTAKTPGTAKTSGPTRDERYDEDRVRELEEEIERRRQGDPKRPDPKAFAEVPVDLDPDSRLDAIFAVVAARDDDEAAAQDAHFDSEGQALRDAIQADVELDRSALYRAMSRLICCDGSCGSQSRSKSGPGSFGGCGDRVEAFDDAIDPPQPQRVLFDDD